MLELLSELPPIMDLPFIKNFGRENKLFSGSTIDRAVASGHLKTFKSAGTAKHRITREDFEAWFMPTTPTILPSVKALPPRRRCHLRRRPKKIHENMELVPYP